MGTEHLYPSDTFVHRHIGPDHDEIAAMLAALGCDSLDALVDQTVPASIRLEKQPEIGEPRGEHELLEELRGIARENRVFRSLIGMGYYDTITPPVIQRNILENPGWYTQYTPYQAEISQGRLEALLNFQTMVADLTALPLANASLLDEATAAAEAMTMCHRIARGKKNGFYVADDCHPQTIAVMQTRAEPLGIELIIGPAEQAFTDTSPDTSPKMGSDTSPERERGVSADNLCGILLQYPTTDGRIGDYHELVERAHAAGALVAVATDLLALTLIKPPGEWGADIAIGSAQRFGVPLGYGGPHAAFMATHDKHARQMPGRIIGVSHDAHGNPAYRMAIQTREQHIRREKATSNICTAQALLAIMAGMYAVYHGPEGLRRIAERVRYLTCKLAHALHDMGHEVSAGPHFDTITVRLGDNGVGRDQVLAHLAGLSINVREYEDGTLGVSLDEKSTMLETEEILTAFQREEQIVRGEVLSDSPALPPELARTSEFLAHPVFNTYHSETEMLRYIKRLESRDLSLTTSMIPLGSCTMKLNGTSEMLPISWPQFASLHPFAPLDQTRGYQKLFAQLEGWLAELTGLSAVTLQPNAGAQGEYTGLLVIRAYHASRGQDRRDVCLIPVSAHGTNPASAVLAGMRVVTVACDARGNVDLGDLRAKAEQHADRLAALMITYPSTHGVFEEAVREICAIVHEHGGQVYMDGANMNAQLGLCSPGEIGADVCHLNLHKTFCIPHGGGGPGMGPIAVAEHLAGLLPEQPVWHSRPRLCSSRSPSTVSTPAAKPAETSYRRNLPHFQGSGRTYFVTFRSYKSWTLPTEVRQTVLDHCLHDHGRKLEMHAAVVMPDHVHLMFTAGTDDAGSPYGLAEILHGIKGAAAHSVNKLLGRKGHVWQDESFDHVLRRDESLEEKAECICQNPVRKKLAEAPDDYPWLWSAWMAAGVTRPGAAGSAQPVAAVPHSQPGAAVPHLGSQPVPLPDAAVPHIGPVSAAPWGSASILPISWMYIALMGGEGLKRATQVAILNANYMANRLKDHYPVLYTGARGRVAHEFIIDCRAFKESAGVEIDDIAKRLMDYGFHAPTMSFPVPGTLMIEPTESESKPELDRLCDALISIREEIRAIERGEADRDDNPLQHAPHTAAAVTSDAWDHRYSRQAAAYPADWLREHKFWPAVGRIDNVYGDRHLFCTCPATSEWEDAERD